MRVGTLAACLPRYTDPLTIADTRLELNEGTVFTVEFHVIDSIDWDDDEEDLA